jgi:hypothetical protein
MPDGPSQSVPPDRRPGDIESTPNGPAGRWSAPIWSGQVRPTPAHHWLAHDWQADTHDLPAIGWTDDAVDAQGRGAHNPSVRDRQSDTAAGQDWRVRNWPGHDWPTEISSLESAGRPARAVPAHRAHGLGPVPDGAPPSRRRRVLVIAGAAFAVLVALGGVGFAEFLAGDTNRGTTIGLPVGPDPSPTGALTAPDTGSTPAAPTGSPGTGPSTNGATTAPTSATAPAGVPASPLGASASAGSPTGTIPPGNPALVGPPPAPANPTPAASPAAAQPTAQAGAISGPGGLCLDLSGGSTADGARVQVSTCGGSSTQRWTIATDGTVQVAGKCAQAASDGSVQLATCGGSATQWRAGSARSLVNTATGRCLTDPAGGARSGSAVTVTTCTGATNQAWSLP